MPPPRPFSSTFQITASIEGTPSLSATVSTSLPASDKTVFASTRIELRVRVQFVEATATGLGEGGENKAGKERPQEVSPDLLLNSWVLAEVKEWMDENKASLNIDSSGPLAVSEDGRSVVVPLHSYRRSSLSHKLSRSAASSASGHAAPPTPSNELASVNLRLSFSPPASPSSSNASQAASQLSQLSSAFSNADFDFHSLASSAPSTSALQALISRAMSKIASKIVICFPLCFNARWIERLSNDLPSHEPLALSLTKMLDNLERGSSLDTKAALLRLRLSTHFHITSGQPPADAGTGAAPRPTATDDLSSALLLLAQRLPREKRDGWKGVTLGASTSSKAQGRAGVVGGEAEESAQRSARGKQNEQAESGAQKDGETPARALGEDVALSQSPARVGEARGPRAVTDERSEEKSPLGAADDEDEEMASMSEGELYSDDDEPLDCGEGGEDAVGEGATVGEAEDWMLGFEEGDWARTEEMGDGVQELVSMEE